MVARCDQGLDQIVGLAGPAGWRDIDRVVDQSRVDQIVQGDPAGAAQARQNARVNL